MPQVHEIHRSMRRKEMFLAYSSDFVVMIVHLETLFRAVWSIAARSTTIFVGRSSWNQASDLRPGKTLVNCSLMSTMMPSAKANPCLAVPIDMKQNETTLARMSIPYFDRMSV